MNIVEIEPAMSILREAADKLKAIGVSWDMQIGHSTHGSSIALIASPTEEGAAAGYVASFLGNEQVNIDAKRFANELADRLAERAIESAKRSGS
ncbi:hypothetical protein [Paraburkholderia kirstenboschensis]|uniref:Uncharacterized protein n=1 Tax=Paraburkholderia kirstenboschensis TaxID=1245436 RepID=A0ABZ0EB20_9BURK|nr:hypothetical protein [Paraburkholderia kirstenboschensis]WOD14404.1 hypothetical protein RW095_02670 [Paraburkholderia kirstenboschensis]